MEGKSIAATKEAAVQNDKTIQVSFFMSDAFYFLKTETLRKLFRSFIFVKIYCYYQKNDVG